MQTDSRVCLVMYQRHLSRLFVGLCIDRYVVPLCARSLCHVLAGRSRQVRTLSSSSSSSSWPLSYSFSTNNKLNENTRKFLVSESRKYSVSSEGSSLGSRLIERWVYEVEPFGRLEIASPMDVDISPLDPHEHPGVNRAIITVLAKEGASNNRGGAFADLYNMRTELCPDKKILKVTYNMAEDVSIPVVCNIKVPLKFDLKVRNTHPSSVSVDGIECEHIDIVLTKGDCNLKNIKCGEVSVDCTDGNITSRSLLQGNISLKTARHGNIDTDRLQGMTIMCGTEFGNMDIKTLYSGRNKFSCCHGDVHIGNCHGNTFVKIDTGNLNIDMLNGNLRASIDDGNVEVFIEKDMKYEDVDITCTTGDVKLKCPENLEAKMSIIADSLSMGENIVFEHTSTPHEQQTKYSGFLKKDDGGRIFVHTKQGAVTVSAQTWLSSLGLKFKDS